MDELPVGLSEVIPFMEKCLPSEEELSMGNLRKPPIYKRRGSFKHRINLISTSKRFSDFPDVFYSQKTS